MRSVWRLDRSFDYAVPGKLAERVVVGSLVRVPFGGRNARGIVVALHDDHPGVDVEDLAALLGPHPVSSPELVELGRWMARRYTSPLPASLARFVPPRVRVRVEEPQAVRDHVAPDLLRAYAGARSLVADVEGGAAGMWVLRPRPGVPRGPLIAELVSAAARAGGSAVVAVPEVRYGSTVIEHLEQQWPELARVDSSVADSVRSAAWFRMSAGHGLAAGGRAALFVPSPNLRLVVVDEEHHLSLKEDRSPRYEARRVALRRSELQGALCVLVSGTPTLESAHAVMEKRARLLEPDPGARRDGRPLIEFAARTDERPISAELHARMRDTLRSGGRIGLLVPRRGFARVAWCASCKRSLRCPRCEAGVWFDRAAGLLRCPRCTFSSPPPDACPHCGADDFRLLGSGSQRLAEQLGKAFPHARVAHVDPDVLAGEVPNFDGSHIYVTTWIGTKEVLRPEVDLVGVVDADILVHRPEWRAAETAYQALAEMSEWAGPGGRLVVQTQAPGHHALQALARADYWFFAERELERRRELFYPPYSELIKVHVTGPRREDDAKLVADAARGAGARVLGPVALAAPRADTLEVLLKCRFAEDVAGELRGILASATGDGRVRVDVDPR